MFNINNETAWTDKLNYDVDLMFDIKNLSANVSSATTGEDLKIKFNVPYVVMELLVGIFAIIGNSLVIIVFYRERKLRKRTNFYIISLALADLCGEK